MIEQQEAMPLLVDACPSFGQAWNEHLEEYGNDVLYVAAGALANHLLALRNSNNLQHFPLVAAAIERLHLEGTPWVKEFATVGVLESVQNVWANHAVDPEEFGRFLGPESQRWWIGLNRFWAGEASHVRAEG
ncbi:MAG: hypothetical protein Q8K29_13490 [Polaromonas sp.]|nr:hypothetical protein [Polaromonas sp.]